MLLAHLEETGIKATLFFCGHNKTEEKGQALIRSWNEKGHGIANHSFNHPNYNNKKVSFENFRNELLQNDSLIRQYSSFRPFFRFPYLKEGNSPEKVSKFRQLMKEH